MTFAFSRTTLPAVAALVLLNGGSAYAAGTEAVAVVNSVAASQSAAKEPASVIFAANQRETNLRKTATFIAVIGLEAPRKR